MFGFQNPSSPESRSSDSDPEFAYPQIASELCRQTHRFAGLKMGLRKVGGDDTPKVLFSCRKIKANCLVAVKANVGLTHSSVLSLDEEVNEFQLTLAYAQSSLIALKTDLLSIVVYRSAHQDREG